MKNIRFSSCPRRLLLKKNCTLRVLCDSPKSTCPEKSGSEMLSANHIPVFFDHQYLWKKSSDILVIFHGVGLQAKAASEKVVVWLAVTRFAFHVIRFQSVYGYY